MEKLGKKIMRISGTVKEVRIFGGCVILFLSNTTLSKPSEPDRVVRFTVSAHNCHNPLNWAQLAIGAKVLITRTVDLDAISEVGYTLKVEESAVIDANRDLDV